MARRSYGSPLLGALLLAGFACCAGDRAAAQASSPHLVLPFDTGWRFSLIDTGNAASPAFNDSAWRAVDLPHDWSAEGPFSSANASGNGYAPGGVGWYRKHFRLDQDQAGRMASIEFDGVYNHAEVWINGHFVCARAYGYSSFECPLMPHLKYGSSENVIAVRVDHSRAADSRWYTGSGIYRHVRLRLTETLRIAHWGTFVTTPTMTNDTAAVRVATEIENNAGSTSAAELESDILWGSEVVTHTSTRVSIPPGRQSIVQELAITKPHRWTLSSPALYTLRQHLRGGSVVTDNADTTFGVRTSRFDSQRGFFLNDESLKLKGVCLHHEAGSLGAAVPVAVWERRLRELKALGVNAIRTSHNPPAPEFLDVCDKLGLLVKDEAFDEFTPSKNKWVSGWNAGVPSRFGYAEDFAQWSVTDAGDMVRRDRNHPSIVMWSVGNEVDYPNDPFSDPVLGRSYRPENPPAKNMVTLARPLVEAIHALDPTRPVTMALASVQMSDAVGLPELLDVVGYNYQESRYADDHAGHPQRVIFGSENSHQFANWTIVRDNPYVAGQFLWTGIDYLGEAGAFPNRANGAGLLDLAGFKKPMAWFRQSLWSDAPMVYLAASAPPPAAVATGTAAGQARRPARLDEIWNWPAGSMVAVSAYTNASEVDLSLNGRSIGVKRQSDAIDGVLRWDVPYEPGTLRAIARSNGRQVAEFALRTPGEPAKVELVADQTVAPDGSDGVAQIEFRIVDRDGVRVPSANAEVTFEIDGPARMLGIGTGDLSDPAPGSALVHRAYQGRGLAIVRSTGPFTLRASSSGLQPSSLTVK